MLPRTLLVLTAAAAAAAPSVRPEHVLAPAADPAQLGVTNTTGTVGFNVGVATGKTIWASGDPSKHAETGRSSALHNRTSPAFIAALASATGAAGGAPLTVRLMPLEAPNLCLAAPQIGGLIAT